MSFAIDSLQVSVFRVSFTHLLSVKYQLFARHWLICAWDIAIIKMHTVPAFLGCTGQCRRQTLNQKFHVRLC